MQTNTTLGDVGRDENLKIEIEPLNRNLNTSHHIGQPPPMGKLKMESKSGLEIKFQNRNLDIHPRCQTKFR